MKNSKAVSIILSTYNGEQFLLEQLLSLEEQSFNNITVYIHDDGSKDKTNEIVANFLNVPRKKKYIILNNSPLKYPRCFIEPLLSIDEADYYAFCDQDDVWYADKIEKAVNEIEKLDSSKPALFYSCVDYCDENLNFVRGPRFSEKSNSILRYDLQMLLFGGEAMGMTYLFNEKVRSEIKCAYDSGRENLKDIFIKILCASYGNVIYSTFPCAQYRRHSQATTASLNPATGIGRYLGVVKKLYFGDEIFCDIASSLNFLNDFHIKDVPQESKELISLFNSKKTLFIQLRKVFWPKRFRLKILDELGYRFAFLIGKF